MSAAQPTDRTIEVVDRWGVTWRPTTVPHCPSCRCNPTWVRVKAPCIEVSDTWLRTHRLERT